MGRWRAWVRGLVVMPLLAALVAGCGGSDRGGGRPGPASAGSLWRTSKAAALGFSDYFAFVSGKDCDEILPDLHDPDHYVGSISNEILDGYSCRNVMTARERGRQCARITVRPATKREPATVSTKPRRLRYSVDWKGETVCDRAAGPLSDAYHEHGSYDVTVEEGPHGWMAVGFTIRTGPGAGHAAGVS